MLGAFLCLNCVFAQHPKLSLDLQEAEWFKEAKFGLFIHWGLYSILGGTYNGHTLPDPSLPQGESWYAEWIQMRLGIPDKEYRALAQQFNPVNFDADQWIKEAKEDGIRYFVITSKHHDGFALWDSQVSDFNSMHTPFKRDILAELVAACKKYGMKYGFYYSHWQDWEDPNGALPYWMPKRSDADFEKYWQGKSLPQVKELLQKFDPDLLWFDTWDEETHITEKRRDELIALVRANSKKCLINGRISFLNPGENIDFLEMHDNQYPDKILSKPWQTPATMTKSWAWHAHDFNWKSSCEMLGYLVNNTSKGGNYLLNIGPKPDGSFPAAAIRRLREMGGWLYANGEAVYGAKPVPLAVGEGIFLTQKEENGNSYLYISISNPSGKIDLPIDAKRIGSCEVLETGQPVPYREVKGATHIELPKEVFPITSLIVLKAKLTGKIPEGGSL